MENRIYNIEMDTPIGLRYGTMTLCSTGNKVNGTLALLEHSEPFNGTVDENGNCTIYGRLVTLMRTIHYTANGKISEKGIELLLHGEQNNFKVRGTLSAEHGGDI